MAIITYTLDPAGSNSGYTRTTFANIQSHYNTTYGSNNLVTGTNNLVINVVNTLRENYSFSAWTTNATYNIEVRGWNTNTGAVDMSRVLETAGAFSYTINTAGTYTTVHHLTFDGRSNNDDGAIKVDQYGKMYSCIIKNYPITANRYAVELWGAVSGCLIYNCSRAIEVGIYTSNRVYNNTVVDCTTGIHVGSGENTARQYIWNNVVYGGTTPWDIYANNVLSAGFNAGPAGSSPPYTGGTNNCLTTITSADFTDYSNDDFSITSTSRLRHTNANFPSGDNKQTSYLTQDYNGDVYPTGASDQWDIGWDFYVAAVTGTIWRVRDSAISNGAVTIVDTTPIEDVSNSSTTSTFASVSSSTNKDTLKVINGVVVTCNDYSQAFLRRGLAIDVNNGELRITNTEQSYGMHWWGWATKNITVGALGKLTITGDVCDLGAVSALNAAAWTSIWGSGANYQDSGSKYPEPAVIFVGNSFANAVPYFNIGSSAVTIANNATHGRTFTFNTSTCAIAFPDNAPTSSHHVYCYNIMLHSKNGQSTNVNSFGFDVTAGGDVSITKCNTTGAANFVTGGTISLQGFGILQNLVLDNCSSVSIDVYRAMSAANSIVATSEIKNMSNQTIGSFSGIDAGSVLVLSKLIGCSFTAIFCELIVAQSGSNYPLIIGTTSGGTDNLTITRADMIGGGIQFSSAISIGTVISAIYHSNDISGTNTANSQHCVLSGADGTRGLRISNITIPANGFPTQLDVFNLTNAIDFQLTSVTYQATIRNYCNFTSCSKGMVSGATFGSLTGQPYKMASDCSDITFQNIYQTAINASPATFAYYQAKNIRFKNVPTQRNEEYLLSGWTTGALPDMNSMLLSRYNAGNYDGHLVQNFYRTSQSIYTLSGTAKTNKVDAVLLPAQNDSVVVTWPYSIKIGSGTSFFKNSTPTIVGTNTGNLTLEYAISRNGGAYSAYQTITAAHLYAESFSANDEFYIRYRVTCSSANATNAIQQIIVYINPTVAVVYPVSLVSVTLQNIKQYSRYWLYDTTTSSTIASGEQAGTSNIVISNIPYSGSDESLKLVVRKSSASPKYKAFTTYPTLTSTGATVYVNQELDMVAV